MSKIYEALLRAEEERRTEIARRQEVPQGGGETPLLHGEWPAFAPAEAAGPAALAPAALAPVLPSAALASAAARPAAGSDVLVTPAVTLRPEPVAVAPSLAARSLAAHNIVAPRTEDAIYSVPGGRPRIDLAAIPRVPWKPLIEKLPALEERGTAVEQFRSLRTRIFGFRDLNTLKSIMVSSGLPREGKSFIAANLAVSFARHKASRVLLIDGDMRRSSLHVLLGCSKSPGLTTYLSGRASMVEVMQRPELPQDKARLQAGLGSITFIGGGDEGDIAADLAGSARFKQLIEAASASFDWIVVDSSPVNLVTDGVNLAAACDAVLMVARGGVTKFEAARRALAELKHAKILGVVLNAVTDAPAPDGYYNYDGYNSTDPGGEASALSETPLPEGPLVETPVPVGAAPHPQAGP